MGLKIGNKLLAAYSKAVIFDRLLYLLDNRNSRTACIGTEAQIVAVDTSSMAYSPIDIGAGKTGCEGDLLYTKWKSLSQILTEGIIRPTQFIPYNYLHALIAGN